VAGQALASQHANAVNSTGIHDAFFYDARFTDARHFALRHGDPRLQVALSQDCIAQQARALFLRSQRVAGLTGYADFTVLTDIARVAGYRLRFHGYHAGESTLLVNCRVVTDALGADWAAPIRLEREVWERQLAAALFGQNVHASADAASRRMTAEVDRRTIHSWLFNRTV
jgi:hypothetical protein